MEQVTKGIYRDELDDGEIVSYRVEEVASVSAFEAWNQAILTELHQAQDDHIRLLYDLSYKGTSVPFLLLNQYNIFNVGVTPDGQQAVRDLLKRRPEMQIQLALVIPDTLSGKIVHKRGQETQLEQVDYRIFFEREPALDWLYGT